MFNVSGWNLYLRLILLAVFILLIYIYPAVILIGNAYYLAIALGLYYTTPAVKIPRMILLMLIPTMVIFGLGPGLFSLLFPGTGTLKQELVFGLGIALKAGAAVLFTWLMLASLDSSTFLLVLNRMRLPDKLIFLLMLSLRYFHSFASKIRQSGEAYQLRRFDKSTVSGLSILLRKLVLEAVLSAENIYYAICLRGRQVILPLSPLQRGGRSIPPLLVAITFLGPVIIWWNSPCPGQ